MRDKWISRVGRQKNIYDIERAAKVDPLHMWLVTELCLISLFYIALMSNWGHALGHTD